MQKDMYSKQDPSKLAKSYQTVSKPSFATKSNASQAPSANPMTEEFKGIDRFVKASIAKATLGLSPIALGLAFADWAANLALSPGKVASILAELARLEGEMARYIIESASRSSDGDRPLPHIIPAPGDRRFTGPGWDSWPFDFIHQQFLITERILDVATTDVSGVSLHKEQVVRFLARQLLDMFSPSNFLFTNPEVLAKTSSSGGKNLVDGMANLLEDLRRASAKLPPAGTEEFEVGKQLGITQGQVVMKNRLAELIQYTPKTEQVYKEPILIVPAWIMKYYILDLSPSNSLVKYLVDQGHTVFMLSWINPTEKDRDMGMDDYLNLGPLAAFDAVSSIVPYEKIHAVGYCLGGTLLSVAAAAMGRDKDDRLASVTLLAAQTDFTEAGELTLFIDEGQVALLDDLMWIQGYLDSSQMAGAFQMLRSSDLIWSKMMREYLMGERSKLNDLMAWNADATRMPFRMHSEYLKGMFLHNDLAEGRYKVNGHPIAMEDIRTPMFVVGTETDHVAPWKSVFKIHILSDSDLTFVLTSGGHNAGIVSEPGHPRRHFRKSRRLPGASYLGPDEWFNRAEYHDGSWWVDWQKWLADNSSSLTSPPEMGSAQYPVISSAPGSYVLQK